MQQNTDAHNLQPCHLDANLHLVDFSQITPQQLQSQVAAAIDKGNHLLDELDQQRLPADAADRSTAAQALQEIIEFDHLGLDLDRSWGILSHLNSVMSNDEIRHVHHELLPKLSAFATRVGQHKPLYKRYQTIKGDKALFDSLQPARQRAIDLAMQKFELSGVALDDTQQALFADIQSQLSTLSAKFSDNVLDATQAFKLPLTEAQLTGITDSGLTMLAAAGEAYKKEKQQDTQKDFDQSVDSIDIDSIDKDTSTASDADTPLDTAPLYVATLDIPVYLAVLTHADDRKLRETLYQAYVTRASEFDTHRNSKDESLDNSDIMAQILKLRSQKADLLGFANYAEVSLSTKMADSVSQVERFLRDLADKATPAAEHDLEQLQAEATKQGIDKIEPWDTAYLAEKVKQAKFNLSQEDIRPYFPLPTVIEGLFAIVEKLFGVRAVDMTDSVSVWHKDVRFYQLYDNNRQSSDGNEDDRVIGGFYFDLYARTGKRSGAWMSGFQSRYSYLGDELALDFDSGNDASSDKGASHSDNGAQSYTQLPVCFMVGNFTPASADKPSLLTHNEVITLFHEFGHGLHHLLTEVSISDVAGVNGVEWDAVELPSQFLENWAWDSEGINLISAHVDTGETLPSSQLDALLAAKNFQSGMQTLRQIEFALFDLLIHAASPAPDYQGILATLDSVRDDVAVSDTPDYNRFANGFSHIFAGGYAAGYYSYKWAELLSADAFSRFEEEGVFNPQTGNAFREYILSVGGSLPAKANFENFRGRAATIDALLRHSGFTDSNHNEVA